MKPFKRKPAHYSSHPGPRRRSKRPTVISEHPLFPTCNGERWPSEKRVDSRRHSKWQFLEVYFRINLAYGRLVALRKRYGQRVPVAREHKLLREIERALIAREKLEDLHARRGVFVTPAYREGFTTDLRFFDGPTARPKGPLIISSASVRITIPLPPGFYAKRAKAHS